MSVHAAAVSRNLRGSDRASEVPAWAAEAKRLHDNGWTYRRLAERFETSHRQIRKVLSPRFAEGERAINHRRAAAKRAWENEHDRSPCEMCGEPMGVGARRKGYVICQACHSRIAADRRAVMVQMRRDGLTNVEIAERLGTTPANVASIFYRERKIDPTIPRSSWYVAERAAT